MQVPVTTEFNPKLRTLLSKSYEHRIHWSIFEDKHPKQVLWQGEHDRFWDDPSWIKKD